MAPDIRVRIAPSPTGPLHLGTARTALFNFLFARHAGGTFVLRLEDTDVARSTEAFEQDILDGLALAGHHLGRGPGRRRAAASVGPYAPYRQMARLDDYAAAAAHAARAGPRLPLLLHARGARGRPQGPGGREAAGPLPRPVRRADARRARGPRGGGPPGRAPVPRPARRRRLGRPRPRPDRDRHGQPRRRLRDRPRRRHAALPLHGRRRRHGDADQPRDPRRGPRQQHAQAHPAVRGARLPAAGVRPPAAHPQPRRDQDEQAQEPDGGRRLRGPGVPARGARQLLRVPGLVAGHGGGRPLARRDHRPVRPRRRSRRAAPGSTASGSSG